MPSVIFCAFGYHPSNTDSFTDATSLARPRRPRLSRKKIKISFIERQQRVGKPMAVLQFLICFYCYSFHNRWLVEFSTRTSKILQITLRLKQNQFQNYIKFGDLWLTLADHGRNCAISQTDDASNPKIRHQSMKIGILSGLIYRF